MEKLLLLDRIADAGPLSAACRRDLLLAARVRHVARGTRFSARVAEPREIVMIVSGIARLFVTTDDGRDVTQHFARAEEFVMPAARSPRSDALDVEAVTDVTCVAIGRHAFEEALSRHPELSLFYSALLRERGLWARERRARSEAVETYEKFTQLYPGLETQVPTIHLASFLGLSPDEFMRARRRYRDRGIM